MIEFEKSSNRGVKLLAKANQPRIYVDINANIIITTNNWDGRSSNLTATISPVHLMELRDECNRALHKITGIYYQTLMHDKDPSTKTYRG